MKKFLALTLALIMVLSLFAGCKKTEDETAATYTYFTYTEALGTNWNPHTWEMDADSAVMSYIETPLTDLTIKDSEAGEYQWIFVAATDIQDVTADHQDDLVKYNCTLPDGMTAEDVTDSYVYEIKLREEMCWQDGTPINADTYIYSMKQLLDPQMQNYRANNYYSGESAVAGAEEYFFQGQIASVDNGSICVVASADDLVLGDDGVYTTPAGLAAWIDIDAKLAWLGDDSLGFYVDYFGATYFDVEAYNSLAALADENGVVALTPESLGYLQAVISLDAWGEGAEYFVNYIFCEKEYETCTYEDTVGVYKVDNYTIRYVCDTAYDYYYFLTSCTSNWLVYESLYESCKTTDEETGLITSNYGTTKDTTISYGPYKMTNLEDGKQMVFEQNEKYWEYTQNEDGTLSSTTFFEVDGEQREQYKTQKVVIDVMDSDSAKLAFLKGEIDDWSLSAEDAITYSTSEQLYQVDETYTMRLFFHTNLDALKKMDAEGTNTNGVVLSNDNFRKAFSLAINRAEFVTATAGFKPAYSLINSLYYYDVYNDPSSIYRNTDEAKQAVCNIYNVEYGEGTAYATLDEAYDSITGYNLTEAQDLMKTACDELVNAGLYTAGQDVVIKIALSASGADSSDLQQMSLLNQYINAAAEGSGFGTITLEYVDNLNNRYADVINGTYAVGRGAWGGAAFYPFTMFRVYCDPSYADIHESGCYDPTTETLTLNVKGEDVTMTWQEWSVCLSGTGVYANEDNETKLAILAGIEENFIEQYYCIPLCSYTACSMLSYKVSYFTENYSIMYGFGGLRLLQYNYSDAEWTAYVASQNGTLGY